MNAIFDTLTLRDETEQDSAFLQQLYAQTRATEMAYFPWTDEQKNAFLTMQFDLQRRHYRENYPNTQFAIILLDNNPVGRWYLQCRTDNFHLIDISLLADYRNQGIGRYLLKTLIAKAQTKQKNIRLHVETTNPALRLYQRLGFSVVEECGFHWLMEWNDAYKTANALS